MSFQWDTSPYLPRCDPVSIYSLPCTFWLRGSCKFGEFCKFSHGETPPGANNDLTGRKLKTGEVFDATVPDEVYQQSSASIHRRGSLRVAAKAEKAEENRKRKEAAALVAERAREEHAKRLVQEKEAREAREAIARQLQLELEVRREMEALATEQDIVLGSSLITYGAGLDIRDVTPGFDLRQVTIKGLPPDARKKEIVQIFTQQGLEQTSFFIVYLKFTDNDNCQEAAVLMSAEEAVAIAIALQALEFRDRLLLFEVAEKAGGDGMRCNSDFLTVFQSPSTDALKYKITIPQQQYKAQERQWDSLSEITSGNDAHVVTKIGDGTVSIYVRGQNKRAVGSLKVRVEHMVAGRRLDPKFWHPSFSFSSRRQRRFFNRIYQTVGVYVRADLKTRSLKAYSGSDASVEEACMMIKEEVDRLAKRETTKLLNPASISFFVRGGLAQLKELLGEENATLNFGVESWHITIKGGEEGRRQLNRLIAESLTSKFMDQILPGDTERETCPICTDEISCPEQLGCGHTYCSQCLQHYLESAPSSKIFPLVCIGDEGACKVPISIPEIRRFLQPQVFQALVEAAFRSYLDQHAQELKFCTTPDCQQIYRHSPNGNGTRTLQCPSCFSTICSACDEEAHEGMTCEERRVYKDPAEQDRLFCQWAAENGGKRCPQCRCVIEKISGCNHITCRCGAEFCWHCGFRGADIYRHMRKVHGGIDTATPAWTITDPAHEEPRQAPLRQPRLRNTFTETVHDVYTAHGAAAPVIQNYDNVEGCCIVI